MSNLIGYSGFGAVTTSAAASVPSERQILSVAQRYSVSPAPTTAMVPGRCPEGFYLDLTGACTPIPSDVPIDVDVVPDEREITEVTDDSEDYDYYDEPPIELVRPDDDNSTAMVIGAVAVAAAALGFMVWKRRKK